MRFSGFCGASYPSQSLMADAEETRNFYLEKIESPYGKTDYALFPTPGFGSWSQATDVGGRALFTMNDRTLGVLGGGVYGFDSVGTATRYGSVSQDSNPATITMNGLVGNQAFITSGGNGYNLNLTTNAITQVLTNQATMGGMLDGYFISFDASAGRIWLSNLNDGTTWDPTQFAVRTAAPDTWKAMLVNPPDIWLIGSYSGDVWYDSGAFPFPLAPRTGLNFKFGIVAPFSLAAQGPTVLWLSQNDKGAGIVVRTQGYQPQRISNFALEAAIAGYAKTSRIDDAEAMTFQFKGHSFYVLTFPTANATWVCDLDLPREIAWTQWNYWNAAANRWDAWKPRVHTFAFGRHLTADRATTTIAEMDTSYATELDGAVIRRMRRACGPFSEHRQFPIRRLEIYLESGLSNASGAGSNALAMLRTSDDGGRTWGPERQSSIGKMGDYNALVRFHRLGVPRDRVTEFSVSDPITNWRIVDAYLNNDGPRA